MKCTSVLPVCTCVYHLNAPGESGVGMIPPGTGLRRVVTYRVGAGTQS